MPSNLWLRLLILALSIAGGICWWIWGRRTENLVKASLIFLWLANLAAFHAYRLLWTKPDLMFLNVWGLAIHLQVALPVAIIGLVLVIQSFQRGKI